VSRRRKVRNAEYRSRIESLWAAEQARRSFTDLGGRARSFTDLGGRARIVVTETADGWRVVRTRPGRKVGGGVKVTDPAVAQVCAGMADGWGSTSRDLVAAAERILGLRS
jgi:hypothetical protein